MPLARKMRVRHERYLKREERLAKSSDDIENLLTIPMNLS